MKLIKISGQHYLVVTDVRESMLNEFLKKVTYCFPSAIFVDLAKLNERMAEETLGHCYPHKVVCETFNVCLNVEI